MENLTREHIKKFIEKMIEIMGRNNNEKIIYEYKG